MAKLIWDADGERKFSMGVEKGVLYPKADSGTGYDQGVAWNGLSGVTESPSGAEPTDLWADNKKYARLISGEDYGFTVEAYTYPEAWEACDGSASPVAGVTLGQQSRKAFGFSWQTKVGNDQPSERPHETVNDSPDAENFSWECGTVPVNVTGYKPVACMSFDSTVLGAKKMAKLEAKLYGDDSTGEPTLPTPDELIALVKAEA